MTTATAVMLTKANVLEQLRAAVILKGKNYRYTEDEANLIQGSETCVTDYAYERDGQPSCIVGHVLIGLGVDPAVFREDYINRAGYEVATLNATKFTHCHRALPIKAEDFSVLKALVTAQDKQDQGQTWGEALVAAKYALGVA